MEISEPDSLGFAELGEMRRELLRMLRGLEPQRDPNDRSDVCDQIQRLCRDGTIPEPIADLMHVVRKCRNRAEYQDRIPEGMEACAIRSAWAAIEDWRQRQVRHAA